MLVESETSRASGAGALSRGRGRWRLRLLAAVLGFGSVLVGAELLLRHVLFGSSSLAERLAPHFRHELAYVPNRFSDDYWKLQVLLRPDSVQLAAPNPHPLLGWSGYHIDSTQLALADEGQVRGRRPILLYGDSNAMCMTPPADCFQGLCERSELGETHALLNFGVGGYGLDQIYLLLRETIDRFADQDPIVIVSFLMDDDLERSALSFRCWPKPRFRVVDGKLVEPEPILADTLAFLEQNPPSIRSYLASYLARRFEDGAASTLEDGPALRERMALNRLLLEAIHAELESRSLEHFFFLFYLDEGMNRRGATGWSEEVVLGFLERSGAPHVSMRELLERVCGPPYTCLQTLIGSNEGPYRGHLNPLGNAFVFDAMLQGLEGRFGDLDFERSRAILDHAMDEHGHTFDLHGRRARIHSRAAHNCWRLDFLRDNPLLGLRAGRAHPTRVVFDLEGTTRRFFANVGARSLANFDCPPLPVRLRIRIDEGEWREEAFALGEGPRLLQLELATAGKLTLEIPPDGAAPDCAWLAFEDVVLQ